MNFWSNISHTLKKYNKDIDLSKTHHIKDITTIIQECPLTNSEYEKQNYIGRLILNNGYISDETKINIINIVDKKSALNLRNYCVIKEKSDILASNFKKTPSSNKIYQLYSSSLGGTRKKRNKKKKHQRSRHVLKI